ncbi:BTB/POZ domain containing protein [Pseudohyphozyma bogoriensis]|nr:BTB/POZ domain containing protein [Pseudohyphozyma bogoriensis]
MSNASSTALALSDPTSFAGIYTIVSSDSQEFKINPTFLSFHSSVFKDMLLGGGEPSTTGSSCQVTESAAELEALFKAMRGDPLGVEHLTGTISLVDKYDCSIASLYIER